MTLITEQKNQITRNIDKCSILQGISLIHETDKEIFRSFNSQAQNQFVKLSKKFQTILEFNEEAKIIFQGAGTSGRFAYHLANFYNKLLKNSIFSGIIAGGPSALIKAKESAEDNIAKGIQDFRRELRDAKKAFFLDISCSGSTRSSIAPLEEIKRDSELRKKISKGILMFNPVKDLDNSTNIIPFKKTIRQIIEEFEDQDIIINPIIGPEAIQGSTRMKGGSATQIILDLTITTAMIKSRIIKSQYKDKSHQKIIQDLIIEYKKALETINTISNDLARIINQTKRSLANKGHVYYIGEGEFGILGIIDASECSPTFGADFEEFRAFIKNGWSGLINKNQLKKLSKKFKKEFPLSLNFFKQIKISKKDTVILLSSKNPSRKLLECLKYAKDQGAKTSEIIFNIDSSYPSKKNGAYPLFISKKFPKSEGFKRAIMKWILNLISTVSYVQTGKTWKNIMIDLKLSNLKLIDRAIKRVIKPILLEELNKDISEVEIIKHLNRNTNEYMKEHPAIANKYKISYKNSLTKILSPKTYFRVDKLVPITILTLGGLSYKKAKNELSQKTQIRRVLEKHLKNRANLFI